MLLRISEHKHISFHKRWYGAIRAINIRTTWTAGGRHKPSGRPYVERQLHAALMPGAPDRERMHLMKSYLVDVGYASIEPFGVMF